MELVEAVKAGNVASVKEFISAGADLNQGDRNGWKPLNWAAARGKLEIVQLLLQHGADVYAVGQDQRTPAMIALAAGHADVARHLRQAEAKVTLPKSFQPERRYCMAYKVKDLRQFAGWKENKLSENKLQGAETANGNGQPQQTEQALSDNDVVYLHENLVVTSDVWRGENVIFDQVAPEWKEFCASSLKFQVPDDLDLIATSIRKSAAHS
jgi:ankyrin repeat protein